MGCLVKKKETVLTDYPDELAPERRAIAVIRSENQSIKGGSCYGI